MTCLFPSLDRPYLHPIHPSVPTFTPIPHPTLSPFHLKRGHRHESNLGLSLMVHLPTESVVGGRDPDDPSGIVVRLAPIPNTFPSPVSQVVLPGVGVTPSMSLGIPDRPNPPVEEDVEVPQVLLEVGVGTTVSPKAVRGPVLRSGSHTRGLEGRRDILNRPGPLNRGSWRCSSVWIPSFYSPPSNSSLSLPHVRPSDPCKIL